MPSNLTLLEPEQRAQEKNPATLCSGIPVLLSELPFPAYMSIREGGERSEQISAAAEARTGRRSLPAVGVLCGGAGPVQGSTQAEKPSDPSSFNPVPINCTPLGVNELASERPEWNPWEDVRERELVESAIAREIPSGERASGRMNRTRYCGCSSITGVVESPNGGGATSREIRVIRLNCKTWRCEFCGPRRAALYKRVIRQAAEQHHLTRLLTLTLDPSKVSGDPVDYLNRTFRVLREFWRRKYGVAPKYIRVLEFQKNGNPHFHLLIDRYMPWAWINAAWNRVGGGMVDVRAVDIHRVDRYLSKYLTKEMLLSAPLWCRRVVASSGITLLRKMSDAEWSYDRASIHHHLGQFLLAGMPVSRLSFDPDGELESFAVRLC